MIRGNRELAASALPVRPEQQNEQQIAKRKSTNRNKLNGVSNQTGHFFEICHWNGIIQQVLSPQQPIKNPIKFQREAGKAEDGWSSTGLYAAAAHRINS